MRKTKVIDFKKVLEAEQAVRALIEQITAKIAEQIAETPLPGVTQVASSICAVKLSAIQKNIWSPKYYLPDVQAEQVHRYLSGSHTATQLASRMQKLAEEKKIKWSATEVVPLNDQTVKIINRYIAEIGEKE